MRKIYLAALAVCFFTVANAQFSSGDKYLTGGFSLNNSKSESPSSTQKQFGIGFSPAFIQFKSDKKAAGFRIQANYGRNRNTSGTNYQNQDIYGVGAGVFSQNYFRLGKGFYFFIEKGIGVNYANSKTTQSAFAVNTIKSNAYSGNIYLKPGVGYKLTNRLLVNLDFSNILSLSYTHQKNETTTGTVTTSDKSNGVNFSSSLNNTSLGNLGITFGWRL